MLVIASFENNINAIVAKDLLQSAGIASRSSADSLSQLYPGAGFVTLEVNDTDAEQAKEILRENGLLD